MVDINVEFVLNPSPTYKADLMVETAIREHNQLSGRDKPDQHPISAIEGLAEKLNNLDTFIYEQCTSSDTWVIIHNLNRYPSVTVVDSAGTVLYPAVHYDSENQCTVTMNGALIGKAYLN